MARKPKKQLPEVLTREFIKANRMEWIEYLKDPKRKKAIDFLDTKGGERCCLGHGCHVFREYMVKTKKPYEDVWQFDGESHLAPDRLVELLGLYSYGGDTGNNTPLSSWSQSSLAGVNDQTEATPQDIGAYLETVIDGGPDTPFRPLTDYPSEASLATTEGIYG